MRRRLRSLAALAVGLGLPLLAVGQASAAVTIGSSLAPDPNAQFNGTFTVVQKGWAQPAPGGATAPSDGVIVRWRIKYATLANPASPTQTAAIRVVRANTGSGQSVTESLSDTGGTYTFPTRLPIRAGDFIGLNFTGELRVIVNSGAPGDLFDDWLPPLPEGATVPPFQQNRTDAAFTYNADIEADADRDGYGDETQDACPGEPTLQVGPCDLAPPETTISKAPKKKSSKKQVSIAFKSSESGSTFECSFDGEAFASCISPRIKTLSKGKHVFQVRATDAFGNVDASPATAKWKVVKKKGKGKGN